MGTAVQEYLRAVIYIGPQQKFAQCLAKALVEELEELDVVKKNDFQDVFHSIEDLKHRAVLLVVDETLCEHVADAFGRLRRVFPTQVICMAFNQYETLPDSARKLALDGTVRSFLPMNLRLDIWLSAVQLMINGGDYMPPEFLKASGKQKQVNGHSGDHVNGGGHRHSGNPGTGAKLTAREIDVLALVARGCQNKIVAAELNLSQHTVKLHMHNIIAKLGVSNRTEAAAIYFEEFADGAGSGQPAR
ncbi:response regulator transcription factor [Nitratireductor sp. XY-223]|uniref:response regulator transcription factor n=1 Tax=Nitratireductor sp. XY-223 TaxID=2561926 RepID=UPI0010A9BFFD|nr:response regulator transcription factor [Nitratireductor sp. XY-223]